LIIVPETIGAITYLFEHESEMKSVDGGYVCTTVAGPAEFGYKESFEGTHQVDRAAKWALDDCNYTQYPFAPTGSDERQYSSPGFRIPTGTITKGKYYEYSAYHTSLDNLSFVSADALTRSLEKYWKAIQLLEMNRVYDRYEQHCEFKLDRHDLHPTTGGQKHQPAFLGDDEHESHVYEPKREMMSSGEVQDAINWLMFGCDGETTLFELASRSDIPVRVLYEAAEELSEEALLYEVESSS
jgi:aminopeptidase-like protein